MGRTAVNGGRGIWRASVPAIAAIASVCSFPRRLRPRPAHLRGRWIKSPAPFFSTLLSLAIMVQTCALPIPLAFLLIAADADAFNEGCETETCCTALCYVDPDGVHHCVHKHIKFCDCEFSADDVRLDSILHPTPITLTETEPQLSVLVPDGWISQTPSLRASFDPPTPSPPPK